MTFDIWMIVILLAFFAYALFKTSGIYYKLGYEDGISYKSKMTAEEQVERVLVMLEIQGIIYREVTEDGESIIYPVQEK
jgi:hypothetical protein